MKRRALIQAGALLTVSAVASGARASEKVEPAAAPFLNLPGMGLPVITDGRVRNYVFIVLKLHLGPAYAVEAVRAKEAHLRDAERQPDPLRLDPDRARRRHSRRGRQPNAPSPDRDAGRLKPDLETAVASRLGF